MKKNVLIESWARKVQESSSEIEDDSNEHNNEDYPRHFRQVQDVQGIINSMYDQDLEETNLLIFILENLDDESRNSMVQKLQGKEETEEWENELLKVLKGNNFKGNNQ